MAYGYRRSYRYRRYRPRRYIRRWFRRRFRRFVNGSSRSISRVKTSFVMTKVVSAGYGTNPGDVVYSIPYGTSDADGSLYHSLLYRNYCNLYEQVKIIGVKVALAVVTPVGDVTTPSLQIYTAWDRNWGQGDTAPTGDNIVSSSTYNVATALNNNVAKITRSCYASDLMEKATWIDTDVSQYGTNKAWYSAQSNPNMFSPSFMFTTISPSLADAHNITVSLSYTYYLAFRNPKYGAGGSGAKDMPEKAVALPDAPVSAADMIADDDEGYGSGPDDITVPEMRAQYDAAVDELEKRRAALKTRRAATSSHVPVTKTV